MYTDICKPYNAIRFLHDRNFQDDILECLNNASARARAHIIQYIKNNPAAIGARFDIGSYLSEIYLDDYYGIIPPVFKNYKNIKIELDKMLQDYDYGSQMKLKATIATTQNHLKLSAATNPLDIQQTLTQYINASHIKRSVQAVLYEKLYAIDPDATLNHDIDKLTNKNAVEFYKYFQRETNSDKDDAMDTLNKLLTVYDRSRNSDPDGTKLQFIKKRLGDIFSKNRAKEFYDAFHKYASDIDEYGDPNRALKMYDKLSSKQFGIHVNDLKEGNINKILKTKERKIYGLVRSIMGSRIDSTIDGIEDELDLIVGTKEREFVETAKQYFGEKTWNRFIANEIGFNKLFRYNSFNATMIWIIFVSILLYTGIVVKNYTTMAAEMDASATIITGKPSSKK